MSEHPVIPEEFLPPEQGHVQPARPVGGGSGIVRRAASVGLVVAAVLMLVMADYRDRGFSFRDAGDGGEGAAGQLVVMSQLAALLQSNYAFPDRMEPRKMLYAALSGIQDEYDTFLVKPPVDLERVGLRDVDIPEELTVQWGRTVLTFGISRVADVYAMVWKMMEVFDAMALPAEIADKMQDAAVIGMLSVLDPHTNYMSAEEYADMKVSTKGSFGGLGIVISVRDGKLTVVSVMPGTPAARQGLKQNDKIVQINEESSINMTVSDAAALMRGEPGTTVDLTIMRDGFVKPERHRFTREVIKVRSVVTAVMPEEIAYVRVKGFQEGSAREVASFLSEQMSRSGLRGVVLDLRGNSGGVLSTALEMADLFMADGTILNTVERGLDNRQEEFAVAGDPFEEVPLVVLVDHGSASASEIVAGAMKYSDRGVVIGERTFGKGSVQYLEELSKGAVKMTVAQYLGPHMEIIQGVGVEPHIEVRPMAHRRWVSPPSFVDDFQGEGGLPFHLERAGTMLANQPPLHYLRYVLALEGVDYGVEQEDEDAPVLDWPAQLAWDLLNRAGAVSALETIEEGAYVLELHEIEQNSAIDELAATEGKRWYPAPLPARSELEVDARFMEFPLVMGVESWLHVTVTNRGSEEIGAAYARTECQDTRIGGRTCLIGDIPAGGTGHCAIRYKLGVGGMARSDRMWVDVLAGHDERLATTEMVSQVLTEPTPLVAIAWHLRDDEGNRNGLPDVGESLKIGLRVTNLGAGTMRGALAVMKNNSGAAFYLTKGRADLPDLGPGDTAMVELEVEVKREPEDGFWRFDIGVADPNGRRHFTASESLAFPASPERSSLVSGYVSFDAPVLRLRAAPYDDAPAMLKFRGPGVLPYDASFRDFLRVPVPGGGVGWVPREVVGPGEPGPLPEQLPCFTAQEPIISIEKVTPSAQMGDAEYFEVRGTVDFGDSPPVVQAGISLYNTGVKVDMVYFGDVPADAGALPFAFRISLREGANPLVLAAFQENRSAGYHSLFYYRTMSD